MGRRKQNFHRLPNPGVVYKKYYQELRAKGISKHDSNQYARMVTNGIKKPLSKIEELFIEEHPEYKDKVSEDLQEVKGYSDFFIKDDEPFVKVDWKSTEQHLIFCNINKRQAEASFAEAGNTVNFKKMIDYFNKDQNLAKYGTVPFKNSMEDWGQETSK